MIFDFSMDPPRIERGTPRCKRGVLPLDYGPFLFAVASKSATQGGTAQQERVKDRLFYFLSEKKSLFKVLFLVNYGFRKSFYFAIRIWR